MSFKLKPAIWSCDTGQRMPWFDRGRLIMIWMSNIKEVLYRVNQGCISLCQPILFGVWPSMLRDSVVGCTRPRAILVMITLRKSTHGFPFLSHTSMGLRLAALRAAGASLKSTKRLLSELFGDYFNIFCVYYINGRCRFGEVDIVNNLK